MGEVVDFPVAKILTLPEENAGIGCTEERPGERRGAQVAGGPAALVLGWLTETERTNPGYAEHVGYRLNTMLAMAEDVAGLEPTHEACAGRGSAKGIANYSMLNRDDVWRDSRLLNPGLTAEDGRTRHFDESIDALGRLSAAGLIVPDILGGETVRPLRVRTPDGAQPVGHNGRIMVSTGGEQVVDTDAAWAFGGAYGYSHGQLAQRLPGIVENLDSLFGGQTDPQHVLDFTTYWQAATRNNLPHNPQIIAVGFGAAA